MTSYTNDVYGRLQQIADLSGAADTYPHDEYGQILRLADTVGAAGTFGGDKYTQLKRVADAVGAADTYPHDVLGQVQRIADGLYGAGGGGYGSDIYSQLARIADLGGAKASAGIRLSASTFTESSAQATAIGTLSVVGATGTPTFTITDTHTNAVQLNADGVHVEVGSASSGIGSFNITVSVSGVTPAVANATFPIGVLPAAPTLALATASDSGASSSDKITNINTPELDSTFASVLAQNDVVQLLDGATVLTRHTVTALEAGSTTIALTGLSPLSDGSHSLTERLERGSLIGAYSSALVITVKTTPPVLSSATGTAGATSGATGTVSTDTGSGTLYWVADVGTAPTAAQVVAGLNSSGAAPADHASQAVSGTGSQSISSSALAASTTYFFYYAHKDVAGNISTVATSNSFTTAAGSSYSTQATQYFNRLNTDPGSSWKTPLAAFIDGLVTDGLWTGGAAPLDFLQLYAMDTQANSLVDLIGTVTPTLNGTPTWTRKLGFSGFSSTANINTHFTPSAGVGFGLNSASMSFYSQTLAQNANYDMGITGSPGCFIKARDLTDVCTVRINNGSNSTGTVTDGSGLFSLVRTSSTAGAFYQNATSKFTLGSNVTTSLPAVSMVVGFVATAGSGRQIALAAAGAARNATQETSFNTRVSTLLAAIAPL